MSPVVTVLGILLALAVATSPWWLNALEGRRQCPTCPHRMAEHVLHRYACLADVDDPGVLWCPCPGRPS